MAGSMLEKRVKVRVRLRSKDYYPDWKWEGLGIHVYLQVLPSFQCFHTLTQLILIALCGKLRR